MLGMRELKKEQLYTSLHQVPSAPIIRSIAVASYNKGTRGRKDEKSSKGCEMHVRRYWTWMFGNRCLDRKKRPVVVVIVFGEDVALCFISSLWRQNGGIVCVTRTIS